MFFGAGDRNPSDLQNVGHFLLRQVESEADLPHFVACHMRLDRGTTRPL
jgi:hypothetical protein